MAKKVADNLPYNAEAERAVLGSALIDNDALCTVLSGLDEVDFYEGRHQLIYRAIYALQFKNINVDSLTVTEELMNMKELENIGGVDYLKECSDAMVALSSLDFYIRIVKNQSVLRNLLLTIRGIDNDYKTQEINDIDNFVSRAESLISDVTDKRRVSTFRTSKEVASEVRMLMQHQMTVDEENVTGLTTGFPNINRYTNGFQKGELTILAARPSVGKTALALNFAYRAASRKHVPVAIFSLEMNSELLIKRLIAANSNVSLSKIATGVLNATEKAYIDSAIREVSEAPLFIDDTPGMKLMDIIAKSKQLQAKHPDLGLIVIDYLGLITTGATSKGADSRQEEVRKISLALKQLARDLKVPLIVLSQLSRDVEKRDTKKPMLSDLRDSGSIEQDADVVMLLYREDYYKGSRKEGNPGNKQVKNMSGAEKFEMIKEQKLKQNADAVPGDASYVDVNIAKNRNGQTGNAGLFFYKAFGRFDCPPPEWEEEMRNLSNSIED